MKALAIILTTRAAAAAAGGLLHLPVIGGLFSYTYRYDGGNGYTSGDACINSSINALDIDWVTGKVTVEYHDEDTVLVRETSRSSLTPETRLHWAVEGGTLKVKYAASGARISSTLQKDLTVTLPGKSGADRAVISATTGDVHIRGGSWRTLDIKDVTGSAYITADTAEVLNARCTTGDINVSVINAGSMELHCTTGDVILSADSFDSIKARSTTGDIKAELPEEPGFAAQLSATTGKVDCTIPHTNKGKTYTVGDGSKNVEMKVTTGNITLS
ncbi:MAG: DUF4097 family beta strand repeat protein [Oscillospiraceae bacterium]|nr:DUF4097 family beta strand repeat protein [Oscillospiraceae bacterium]